MDSNLSSSFYSGRSNQGDCTEAQALLKTFLIIIFPQGRGDRGDGLGYVLHPQILILLLFIM